MELQWPDMFTTGIVECDGTTKGKLLLVADALTGWANCHIVKPPENFGSVMVQVFKHLGVATEDELMKLLEELTDEG